MSVLSPVVATWSGTERRIYLNQGVSDFYPIEDIYHEYRNERRTDESFRRYEPLLRAEGNIPKGGGAFTPRYVVLLDGTKIVPYDETLQVNQLGDMITDDPDADATLYDVSGLTVAKPIFIKPSEAETIQLNSESIVYSSFQGGVWIDVDSIYDDEGSAAQPNGNTERPVNNLSLAMLIANTRGFDTLFINKSMTLDSGTDIQNFNIIGKSITNTYIDIDPNAICNNICIKNCNVSGTLDGNTQIDHCSVGDLVYVNGHIHNCGLYGTIVLGGNDKATVAECYTTDQDSPLIVDMGGSGQSLMVPNYSGTITIKNLSSAIEEISIGLNAGVVILDETISAGTILISGNGRLIDNSTGTASVDTDGLMSKETITEIQWDTVWVNSDIGESGTVFPLGTESSPVDNMEDAKTIAAANKIKKLHIYGNVTINSTFENYLVESYSPNAAAINLNDQILNNTVFKGMTLTGNAVGIIGGVDCELLSGMTGIQGHLENCILAGTFIITAGETLNTDRCTCPANTIFNLNGTGSISGANFSGIATIMNATDAGCAIGITGYYLLTLMDTCTAGQMFIAGIGILNNNSNGSTVTERTLPSTMWDESTTSHSISDSFGNTVSKIKKETGLIPALV